MTDKNSSKPPPETPVRGTGGADLRQPKHTGSPDWSYWAKLSEVKVWEALELLDGREPAEHVSEIDTEDKGYQRRLRLLLDAMPDRSRFSPTTLNMSNPLLHGVVLAEVGRWAKENEVALPRAFPVAPPRIAWEFWKARKGVKLWEACLLSVGLDPERARFHPQAWMAQSSDPLFEQGTFPTPDTEQTYRRRLTLLKEHRDDAGHFTALTMNDRAVSMDSELPVSLTEFSSWANATGLLPMPSELEELAAARTLAKLGVTANPRRLAELNAGLPKASVNWDLWLSMPRLPLWMAVALSLALNPGPPSQNQHTPIIRDRQRTARVFGPEFVERLDVAMANLSTDGPLVPLELRGGILQDPSAMVSMRGFVQFTQSLRTPWGIPQELAALVARPPAAQKLETKEERDDRRLGMLERMCKETGAAMPKNQHGRMPEGIGKLADLEEISRQAFTESVKAALKRKEQAQPPAKR